MNDRAKSRLRNLAFRSGVLTARHRLINRNRLTVVMFHRVLSPDDSRWAGADPEYTLSVSLFAEALAFLRDHYSIVGLGDLLAANSMRPLPPCPLLITIDDGWADTAEYALPELRSRGLQAVVFVAAGAVGQREAFWPERLYAAWRTGHVAVGDLVAEAAAVGIGLAEGWHADNSEAALRRCIAVLETSPKEARAQLVRGLASNSQTPAQMLSSDQVAMLAETGIAVGAHGYTHEPLTGTDALDELTSARARLEECTSRRVTSVSFPHGRYDRATVAAAVSAGYRLMFTSEPTLTQLSRHRLLEDRLLGRIDIPGSAIRAASGSFSAARMATWLFPRPARHLESSGYQA